MINGLNIQDMGRRWETKGDNKSNPPWPKKLLTCCFGRFRIKVDKAVNCYRKSANYYQKGNMWKEAGEVLSRAAKLYLKEEREMESSLLFLDSANCYANLGAIGKEEVRTCLRECVIAYKKKRRLSSVAKCHQRFAEFLEDIGDLAESVDFYKKSSKFYKAAGYVSAANQVLQKAVEIVLQQDNGSEAAVRIYEEMAMSARKISLLKDSAIEYWYRAGLLHLRQSPLSCQQALELYCEAYPAFGNSPAYLFLKNVSLFTQDGNLEELDKTLARSKILFEIDNHLVNVLRERAQLNAEEDHGDENGD